MFSHSVPYVPYLVYTQLTDSVTSSISQLETVTKREDMTNQEKNPSGLFPVKSLNLTEKNAAWYSLGHLHI